MKTGVENGSFRRVLAPRSPRRAQPDYVAGLMVAAAIVGSGCSGISDCKEDGAQCAAMLNQSAEACATSFTLKLKDRGRKFCTRAIETVGDQKVAAAVPGLLTILATPESGIPEDEHRAVAAKALGKIGDSSAVDGLLSAIDTSVGTSDDPKDKMGTRANEEIAKALGKIGDAKAVPGLLSLMKSARDAHVRLEAVRSLGELKADSAVEPLLEMALEDDNKFMRKNAVQALGNIGHPDAIDGLVKMMFIEFQGVSFYREASYALFQIGPESVEPLLETLALNNKDVAAIFEQSGGLKESAIIAKCAVVLGDLRDSRALEPLIEAYEKSIKKNDPLAIREIAFALGALNDPKAVPALMKNMGTPDASLRERIMDSLVKIGDRRPVKGMIEAMTKKDFVKRCVKLGASKDACSQDLRSRAGAVKAAADMTTFLADASHLDAFKKAAAAEENETLKKYLGERLEAAEISKECGEDVGCWTKYAQHDKELFRQKAYWELGRLGGDEAKKVLINGLKDKKRKARAAAIYSYWKVGDASVVPTLEAQLEKERGMSEFIVVNEDLKRMALDLRRRAS